MSGKEEKSGDSQGEEIPLLEGRAGTADPRIQSAGSEASAARIHLHSQSSDLGGDGVTPVDDKAKMATVIGVNGFEDSPGNGDGGGGGGGGKRVTLGQSQAGVVELSALITNPALKRSESAEVLNLTLHQCARDGNADNMRRMLQSLTGNVKKKVNAHDDEDLSALHYAARYNHVNLVTMMVEAGADVDDVDEEGATPLHFAARYKRMRLNREDAPAEFDSTPENSVVMYLAHRGANINARDIYGCTPLHFASMRGNEVVSKELLSFSSINIEAVDKQQMTALHMAASHDEVEIVKMLIESGANLRCCDEDEATPLHYACMEGSIEVAQLLFAAGEKQDGWVTVSQMVTDQDNQQNTSLHLAVENRSFEVAKLCIDKGADVNTSRNNYSTPLHMAAVAGDVQIVELLLDHNARIDALDVNQSTPLHKAAGYNHADVVEFLLDRGAKIDKHDKDNFSPLLFAACNGHVSTIEKLLQKGADLYAVDKNDKTAIYWAAAEDNIEALNLLLEHISGKDQELIDASDRYDNTPLHVAAENGYLSCVKVLLDHNADLNGKTEEEKSAIHLSSENGKTGVVRELVRRNKMVINDEDEDSNTALHLASLAGHNKVVQALLDAGADIEARNCTLWTPLDCAAAKGWAKTVKVLLEADAPIDPMDKTKTTPLHLACSRGHVAVVNLLLKWHASASQRDVEGNNCLDLAIDNGQKDVANAIIASAKWKDALRNETMDLKSGERDTPMRKLIRKLPDIAEKVFNKCTTSNVTNPDQPNYEITFNYEFLDDMYSSWREADTSDALSSMGSIYDEDDKLLVDAKPYSTDSTVLKNNHPLTVMVKNDQEDLLVHPLVTSLLRHKWNTYGRYMYYANLFIYAIFLTFLTGYVCTTTAPYMFDEFRNSPNATSACDAIQSAGVTVEQHWFAKIGKYVIIVLAAIDILKELFQIYNAKLQYLGWENLIEWVTYISALLLVIDFNQCQRETGIREAWQWQLAAVAIFLAWIELVLFFRKFPRFGIYIVMFTDILFTFAQFFPVFALFIVAFGLCYYVLLANQYSFRDPFYSIIKTSVMMIGEFEYTSVLEGVAGLGPSEDDHDVKVYYTGLTYGIFIVFLVLMSIIIMNLLVGLAVDDIKAVQDQAILKRLAMQVELALDVESILPQFVRRKFVIRCKTVRPNEHRNPIKKLLNWDSSFMSASQITKALNPELDDIEVVQENQEKMMTTIGTLKWRMKNMESQQNQINSMLLALMKHHGVNYEDEDEIAEDDSAAI